MKQCAVPGCTNGGKLSRGWCKPHYDRWHRTGSTDFPPKRTVRERILDRTHREGDCLLFDGSTDEHGRGWINVDGQVRRCHRVLWELDRGPIPEGLVIRHTCDVAGCLNLDHMILGTQADNMRDLQERGRGRWTICRNGLHELSDDNVYVLPSQPGYRECRKCRNERNRRYHERTKNR